MSAKSNRMKYAAIAVVLIVVLVVGGFLALRSRTQTRTQVDEISPVIAEISKETGETSTLWKSVESKLEDLRAIDTSYDKTRMTQEADYCETARSTIADIKNDLDSITAHHDNVAKSLQDLAAMEVPDWFPEYLDLKNAILDKDRERVDKVKEMLGNLDTYYMFSEKLLLAMIAEYDMEEVLKDAVDMVVEEDYAGAQEQFEKAADRNSEVKGYAAEASSILTFNYLDRLETNREKADAVIQKYIEVCDLADKHSYNDAKELAEEAEEDYRSIQRVYLSDFKPENQAYWKENIGSIGDDIKELGRQIDDLEYQAASLLEKNKPD